MRSSLRAVVLFVSSLTAVVACSETSSPKAGGPANIDAGANDFDAGGPSEVVDAAPRPDADVADADGGLLQPTKKTAVAAAIGGVTRTLHRAQFGVTKDGASETLHIEAHEGGVASCPETGTPERTLVVGTVPKGEAGDQFDQGDGVDVAFLDFIGDQLTEDPTTQATSAKVTIVAFVPGVSVEIEVEATFPEGTARGRVYATYCEGASN